MARSHMPKSDIEKLKRQVPIADVVGATVALEPQGKHLVGKCPFHDDSTPSLSVTPSTNLWRCFGCGAAGSGSNYAAEATVADFAAALAAANTAMDGTVIYAAYAVGADVFVFADTNADGTADQAVFLAGSTLADVSSASFI